MHTGHLVLNTHTEVCKHLVYGIMQNIHYILKRVNSSNSILYTKICKDIFILKYGNNYIEYIGLYTEIHKQYNIY